MVENFLCRAMVPIIFDPTRTLPSSGLSLTRPPGFLPCRSIAICAARRPSRNATPVFRPSIPSILKTLNAGQVSVVQVITSLFPPIPSQPNSTSPTYILQSFSLRPNTVWDKLVSIHSIRGFYIVFQVLESQAPFLKLSDWFALLEGLGKQNTWTLTLEVPAIVLPLLML